ASIQYPATENAPRSPLPFSLATQVGNLLFVSGQASVDANGAIVSDTFEGEFRRSLENLRKVLQASGSDLDKVVRVCGYVRDPANLGLYNKLYREYFKEPFPARTTLTNCLPETLQFEIDCIAVVDSPDAA
ncbi:MAG TPA: RidA family protein, partial [Abditibacteriaceae bacterium]|nr:RidA family protein [Abditibacteriaceae bacterium]